MLELDDDDCDVLDVFSYKVCTRCDKSRPLTDQYWYRARPTATHKKGGWQSYCKVCWKVINKLNKDKLRANAI